MHRIALAFLGGLAPQTALAKCLSESCHAGPGILIVAIGVTVVGAAIFGLLVAKRRWSAAVILGGIFLLVVARALAAMS